MQMRQAAIKSRQLATMRTGELSEVGIGYLAVADDAVELNIGERDTV
ncbi:hypothetical protein BH09ACT8_BH09ACT8_56390 [soil metagenome]